METENLNIDKWVDCYGDQMYRYTLFRVKDPEEAEEIVQTAFLAALQSRTSYSGLSPEKHWLFGILKHKILDYFQALKKHQKFDLLPEDDRDPYDHAYDESGNWAKPLSSWGINPETATENKQLAEALAKCMDGLSAKFRQVFILREIEEVESEEICKKFDIQPNNLWVILHRARNQLKKCLEINWFQKQ